MVMAKVKIKAKVVKKKIPFVLIRRIGRKIKHAASAIYNNIIKPVISALYSLLIIRVILWIVATMLLIYSFFEFVPKKAYVSYNGNATMLPSISSRQCIAEMQSIDFRISNFETLTLLCTRANINGNDFIGNRYDESNKYVEIFIESESKGSSINFFPVSNGENKFKYRITTNRSDNSFVTSNITYYDPKYGYAAYIDLTASDGMEIESQSDIGIRLKNVNMYYYDGDVKKELTSSSRFNDTNSIILYMDNTLLDYGFVAMINGECTYHLSANRFEYSEIQGLLTFTDCQDMSVRSTGYLELNYTKDRTDYPLQNQDLDLQSRSSLTSRVTLDEDYIFDYMIDLEVFGHINSGHVSGFDLFPNFFEWCATNIYVIPMTIFTSILSAVVVFSKDKNKKK